MTTFTTIRARYPGVCKRCYHAYPAGAVIRWARGGHTYHRAADCPVKRRDAATKGETETETTPDYKSLAACD